MLKLRIPAMGCGHCVSAIEQAIRSVDPDAMIDTDLQARLVAIGTEAPPDSIRQAVEHAGYANEAAIE